MDVQRRRSPGALAISQHFIIILGFAFRARLDLSGADTGANLFRASGHWTGRGSTTYLFRRVPCSLSKAQVKVKLSISDRSGDSVRRRPFFPWCLYSDFLRGSGESELGHTTILEAIRRRRGQRCGVSVDSLVHAPSALASA